MSFRTRIKDLGKGYSSDISSGVALSLVFLVGTLTTLFKYQFVSLAQIDMLPMIYRVVDPQFLTNDFFTNSSQLFNEDFVFAKLVGSLAKLFGLSTVVFVLTLVANLGIAVVAYFSAKDLSKGNRLSGLLAAILFLSLQTFQWGNRAEIFRYDLTPEHLIMPFLILCIWQGLKQKIFLVGLFAALATIIHPLSGPGIGGIMLLQILIRKIYRKELSKTEWLNFILAGILICIPATVYVVSYAQSLDYQMTDALFIEIMKVRFPHHYFPSFFLQPMKVLQGLLLLTVAAFSWYEIRDRIRAVIQPILITAFILSMFCVIGWFFAEIIPNRLIITLQLWRFLVVLKILALLSLAMSLGSRLSTLKEIFSSFKKTLMLNIVIALCLYLTLEIKLLISFMILIIVLLFSRQLFWISFSLVCLLVINNNFFSHKVSGQAFQNYFKAEIHIADLKDPEAELANFIKTETPEDSRLLCGPRNGRLRILAERALVIDGTGIPMNDKGMEEWWNRLNEVYNRNRNKKLHHIKETQRNYNQLNDLDFLELKNNYDFGYVVVSRKHQSDLKTIYQNQYLKLLEMPSLTP